jgi:hypothetical protein
MTLLAQVSTAVRSYQAGDLEAAEHAQELLLAAAAHSSQGISLFLLLLISRPWLLCTPVGSRPCRTTLASELLTLLHVCRC